MESPLVGCTPDVREHNQAFMNETQDRCAVLPVQFVLQKPDTNFAVLVKTTLLPHNCWKFELVRDPCHILHNYVLVDIESYTMLQQSQTILVQRESRKPDYHKKLYRTQIVFAKQGLIHSDLPNAECIPVLKMTNPHAVLSSHFTRLTQIPAGSHWRFPFEMYQPIPDASIYQIRHEALEHAEHEAANLLMRLSGRRPPTPPPERSSKPALPQHMVNVFVEAAVGKGELCPITQDPLTKDSMVVTPCGHGLDNSSAKYWISTKHSCPVCRHPCAADQLQKWSA